MHSGSVTRAAEMLHVSQPAVSQLIRMLEMHCGFALFTRTGTHFVPTSEAETLLSEVDRMFIGVNQVARVATALRDQRWGNLSVAVFPAMAARFLPQIVTDYCCTRPSVRVSIESQRSAPLIDWVATDRVDFGIGLLPGDRSEVRGELIYSLPGVCAVPIGHRLEEKKVISAEDLADEPFISLGRQDRSRFGIDKIFDDLGVPRRLQIETEQSKSV
jgi:DNA-binding transcriptional LysR family regulator